MRLLRELQLRGTLAAVATALGYSPSAVSQQLTQLEKEVGVRLLESVGRGVRLTPQAEIVVRHTEAILRHLEEARAEVARSLIEVSGTLRIACFQTAALTLLPVVLGRMKADHPDLMIEVSQSEPDEAHPRLAARDVDLAVAEEYPGHPQKIVTGLHREDFLLDRLRLARPAGTDAQPPVTGLDELRGEPWILEPEGKAAREWARDLFRTAGFEPVVPYESIDLLTHAGFVEAGLATAVLPDLLWLRSAPHVVLQDLPGPSQARTLFTLVRTGSESHPAITALRAAFREVAATSPPK